MTLHRKIFLSFGLTLVAAVLTLLVYGYGVVPLKFRYLVHRVESASTADEERRAFQLAADWGRVFEADRLTLEEITANGRRLAGDWLLRLEWLESSPFGGGAYVAYRAVIDTNNLQLLARRY